jgi:hypothetical protein
MSDSTLPGDFELLDGLSATAILSRLLVDPAVGEYGRRILFAALFHVDVSVGLRPAIGLPFRTVECWLSSLPPDSHAGLVFDNCILYQNSAGAIPRRCVAVPRRASLFQGSFWRRLIQILRGT